jgi:hypothetical protein
MLARYSMLAGKHCPLLAARRRTACLRPLVSALALAAAPCWRRRLQQ